MLRNFRFNDNTLIILILIAGAILRFWRLPDIPFTHDEFSAIIRTRFDTLGQLIEKGIMVDGHPAGVQLLIYWMVHTFGVSEAILKTPFILFGTLSILFIYLIGKQWFNATAGLISASFLAFLQYPIMYSQVARPYASGLFFALLMVWFWTRAILNQEKRFNLNLAGFALSAALCAYNHHFSMLFAIIVGATGIFLLKGKKLRIYLIFCLGAILLYLPHLPVLVAQLKTGGVEGWLQKPRYDFLYDYLKYVFQFSVFTYLLIITILSLGLYLTQRISQKTRRFLLISLVWFLVPLLVGFFYSKYRSAVLQNSVLIFSFPCLLFLLFGWINASRMMHRTLLVFLIAVIVIPTLVYGRRHYDLFYANPYREMINDAYSVADAEGKDRVSIILDTKKEIAPYYLKKLSDEGKLFNFRYMEDIRGEGELLDYLDSLTSRTLVFGCLSSTAWENYALIRQQYPYLIRHRCYSGGDFYVFSRDSSSCVDEYHTLIVNNFDSVHPDWNYFTDAHYSDSLPMEGLKSFVSDTVSIYSPTFSKRLWNLIKSGDDVIDISADLELPAVFPGAWMIATVTSEERTIYYKASPVAGYILPGNRGRVFISLRMSDIELRHRALQITAYLWNPRKAPYRMDNFRIAVREGNPVLYGLYRKIPITPGR